MKRLHATSSIEFIFISVSTQTVFAKFEGHVYVKLEIVIRGSGCCQIICRNTKLINRFFSIIEQRYRTHSLTKNYN